MYKILVGIPAMFSLKESANNKEVIIDQEFDDCENTWCDFEFNYYPDGNYYQFEFETLLGFKEPSGCRTWICDCLDGLTYYMNIHNLDTSRELNLYEVFTEGYNVKTKFKDIETAYAWLKMMVNGFQGNGLVM